MTFKRSATAILLALLVAGSVTACAPEHEPAQEKKPAADQAAEAKSKSQKPQEAQEEEPSAGTKQPESDEPDVPSTAGFDHNAHSIDDPMSIWVVSNKLRPLTPTDFEPTDLVPTEGVANDNGQPLREVAARAAEQVIAGARESGHDIRIISAYRNYALQVQLYDGYIARDGQALADTYSARPGHSEHQTGLTVDFDDYGACYLASCFGDTAAGQWLVANAATYGFIERYPAEKEHVTGFMPEPWHFRYVGPELAAQMQASGVTTLEEFFGLPAAPGYAD